MKIQTERLVLRSWSQQDYEAFAQLNADPRVMEFFPATLPADQSIQKGKDFAKAIESRGWGLWAVSEVSKDNFIGFVGLNPVDFTAHFTPAIEVGWRLAFDYWGKGYATEGALAAVKFGFEQLGLHEIVAFTTVQNVRSRNVMDKIGMQHDPSDDFDHPKLPAQHPLKRCVLYRLSAR